MGSDDVRPKDLAVCARIGSALVHAEEFMSVRGHTFDKESFNAIMNDDDIRAWLKKLDDIGLLPKKRDSLI